MRSLPASQSHSPICAPSLGQAQALFAVAQRLLRQLLLGHVAGNAENAYHLALVIAQRPLGGQEHPPSQGRVQHLLAALHAVIGQHLTTDGHQHLGLLRWE